MHGCSKISSWDDEAATRLDALPPCQPPEPFVPRFERTLRGLGDRRGPDRRKLRTQVLIAPLEAGLPGCRTTTEDISRRGVFVVAPHQYPLGTVLRVTLETPYGGLELTGRVVHRIDGVGIGCEFVDLNEPQRDALDLLAGMSRQSDRTLPPYQ